MTTSDIIRENWENVQDRLEGLRWQCWVALSLNGPGRTRDVAEWAEIPLLTVRPRMSELLQLGFIVLDGRLRGEGIYRARTVEQAREAWQRVHGSDRQLEMPL